MQHVTIEALDRTSGRPAEDPGAAEYAVILKTHEGRVRIHLGRWTTLEDARFFARQYAIENGIPFQEAAP